MFGRSTRHAKVQSPAQNRPGTGGRNRIKEMFNTPLQESRHFSGPDASAPLSRLAPDARERGPFFQATFFVVRAETNQEKLTIETQNTTTGEITETIPTDINPNPITPSQYKDANFSSNRNETEDSENPYSAKTLDSAVLVHSPRPIRLIHPSFQKTHTPTVPYKKTTAPGASSPVRAS